MVLSTAFGNFPRPDFLREYQIRKFGHQKKLDQKLDSEDEKVLLDAKREVVDDQTGLDIITDGELSWDDYLASLAATFSGIEMKGLIRFYDNNRYYRRPTIVSEVSNDSPSLSKDLETLKEINPGSKIKATIPGPYSLYMLSEDKFYGNAPEAMAALTEALIVEVEALDADFIQIDEPSLSYHYDADVIPAALDSVSEIVSKAKGKTILATYFGKSMKLMNEIRDAGADYLGIDCVSYKENYEALVASGIKNVQLGLLDARNTKLEDHVELKNKIDMIDSEDIILSTNCGLEFLPREYALRKVDLLSSLANEE